MLLLIDNYDSFTYNLVQYLGELGAETEVYRNDKITPEDVSARNPDGIVISPGPCTPREAGVSNDIIQTFSGNIPILGVCLGHQCIGHVFGGIVRGAPTIMHGKTSRIYHTKDEIFDEVSNPFEATRYHSLIVAKDGLPDCLQITAETDDGIIMGLRHKEHPTWGVQFHPESILTSEGKLILANFMRACELEPHVF